MTLGSGKAVTLGMVMGMGLALVFALPDSHRTISYTSVFDRIQIGMAGADAVDVLRQARIDCGINDHSASGGCHFSDFTGEYFVQLDPNARYVMEKSYHPRPH